MRPLRRTALLIGLVIVSVAAASEGQTAFALDTAWNAKTAFWNFTSSRAHDCAERVIWLKPGRYDLQIFVDRWKAPMVSDWEEGAKRSSIRSVRVPRPDNYLWTTCAAYGPATKAVARSGRRLASTITIGMTLSAQHSDWGWLLVGDSVPRWGTSSADGTYHFGSWLRWRDELSPSVL